MKYIPNHFNLDYAPVISSEIPEIVIDFLRAPYLLIPKDWNPITVFGFLILFYLTLQLYIPAKTKGTFRVFALLPLILSLNWFFIVIFFYDKKYPFRIFYDDKKYFYDRKYFL